MTRGHQERLAPLVREVMAEAGVAFSALDRIVVTVGPGSFTGLRVGLAFAKGLGFALDRPCVGVGSLEALAAGAGADWPAAAVIDAGRGNLYLQLFDGDLALTAPDVLSLGTSAARLAEVFGDRPFRLTGPAADQLTEAWPDAERVSQDWPRPEAILRLGEAAPLAPARPLYLRPPDAKPKAARPEPAWS